MRSTHLVGAQPARRAPKQAGAQIFPLHDPSPVAAEINGYIAVRDQLLEAAEQQPSSESLARARRANELVQNCLKPARHPYEAQVLPEAEALRERRRCDATNARIDRLTSNRG